MACSKTLFLLRAGDVSPSYPLQMRAWVSKNATFQISESTLFFVPTFQSNNQGLILGLQKISDSDSKAVKYVGTTWTELYVNASTNELIQQYVCKRQMKHIDRQFQEQIVSNDYRQNLNPPLLLMNFKIYLAQLINPVSQGH